MNEETTQQMKASALKWLTEVLHMSSKTITALVIITGFVWTVGAWSYEHLLSDPLAEEIQQLSGMPQVVAAVEQVDRKVDAQGQRIDELGAQMAQITPSPIVVEYDPLRSRALGPCYEEEVCYVQFRIKRTEFGKTCGTPEVLNRTFVDFKGLVSTPLPAPENRATRALADWSVRQVGFIPPGGVTPGLGEYSMLLRYPNCTLTNVNGRTTTLPWVEEETEAVKVLIREREAE